jgi:hypothetical protein
MGAAEVSWPLAVVLSADGSEAMNISTECHW